MSKIMCTVSWCVMGRQLLLVSQLCPTLCDPMECSTPGSPVHHQLLELIQTHEHPVGDTTNHLILYRPLLLLPSIFPSIRVFSSESALRIRWPRYWSFSFSIGPSSKYSGLISFRVDWFDLPATQGTLSSTTVRKHQFFGARLSLRPSSHIHTLLLEGKHGEGLHSK